MELKTSTTPWKMAPMTLPAPARTWEEIPKMLSTMMVSFALSGHTFRLVRVGDSTITQGREPAQGAQLFSGSTKRTLIEGLREKAVVTGIKSHHPHG